MKKLKSFRAIVDKGAPIILIFLIVFLIIEMIWVTSVQYPFFSLFPRQYFDQILVGQYTLAVTIILGASALIGGIFVWLTTTFRHGLEEKYREIEEIYNEVKTLYKELFNKKEHIIGGLQNLTFSARATWLFLAKQIETAGGFSQREVLTQKELFRKLKEIFENAAFFESQTIRLFTAEDRKDVEAAAIFIFHKLHDEIGKRLLEDRLRLETSMENPDPKVIESLSRLLGAW